MNYYIDFEANDQQEIISLGCIREDGQTFYSLIHSENPISSFLTDLTGITNEMLEEAEESEEVLEKFYDFCNETDMPQFYCYGSSDIDFIMNTFNQVNSFKAGCVLGYMYTNMADFSEDVKEHFYVNKTISLEKVSNYYLNEFIEQNHNALDDAIRLKLVYEKVTSTSKELNVFNEYLDNFTRKAIGSQQTILRLKDGQVMESYSSMQEVEKWILSQPNEKDKKYVTNIPERITKAAQDNIKYFKYNWRII